MITCCTRVLSIIIELLYLSGVNLNFRSWCLACPYNMEMTSRIARLRLACSKTGVNIFLSNLFLSNKSYTWESISFAETTISFISCSRGLSLSSFWTRYARLIMTLSGVTISWVTEDESMCSSLLSFSTLTSCFDLVTSRNVATLHSSLLKIRSVKFNTTFRGSLSGL